MINYFFRCRALYFLEFLPIFRIMYICGNRQLNITWYWQFPLPPPPRGNHALPDLLVMYYIRPQNCVKPYYPHLTSVLIHVLLLETPSVLLENPCHRAVDPRGRKISTKPKRHLALTI